MLSARRESTDYAQNNHFDGFKFNFIQNARLLKENFQRCRRLIWGDFPYIFQMPDNEL